MDHKKAARDILQAIGKDNIQAAAHCATRLRLVLKDDKQVNQKALDNHPDIKGTFKTNGQYQIIIGPGDVNNVYDELIALTGLSDMSTEDIKAVAQNKGNPLIEFVKVLSDIFVPIIPALVAGGLLMALNNILTAENLFASKSVVQMVPGLKGFADFVNVMSAAPFAFLPVLIGYSATKRFGGNPYLGAAMAMIMVSPSLINGYEVANAIASGDMKYWNLFGLHIAQAGYQGSVIPVLAVSWILAKMERFFHKHMADAFDFTFTPMLSVIITGFLTFTIVGPVLRGVSDGLTDGLMWLYNTTGPVGTAIFGFFYSAIVITGLHQSFPAIETTLLSNIASTGGSFIFPIASMANIAQGAACLAVFLITKNEKQKSLSSSASVSALLGITEPAIFGVNLKLRFPFICAMIGSGIASIFIGLFKVLAVSLGPASVIGFIAIRSAAIPMFIVCCAISFVIAFVLTFLYGKGVLRTDGAATTRDTGITAAPEETAGAEVRLKDDIIYSPAKGIPESLTKVNDKVFSAKLMGDGAAIVPDEGIVYAPADGIVTVTYDSKHAYGIQTANGAEVLIHIGIDTVQLGGRAFTSSVEKGQKVKKGDKLGTFDIEKVKEAGYDPTVMVIITNTMSYGSVERISQPSVEPGDPLIAVTAVVGK
ncbi:PTS beta-glucoside transporter subunit IIBCA [Sporolactobacillus sp. THM7-7]|nr:PTS beta-glucoside transporter subunit IIBCA [Sporolactobacillus sp. THM7-7]